LVPPSADSDPVELQHEQNQDDPRRTPRHRDGRIHRQDQRRGADPSGDP